MFQLWSQDNFTRGELSPYMYAKAQVASYYNGLKTAQNVLTYPTGAAGKRFGTLFQAILSSNITASNQIFFQIFQWFDNAIFQLVFSVNQIDIYLEGILISTVTTTFNSTTVYNLDFTVIEGKFRVTGANIKPFDLSLSLSTPDTITAVGSDFLTLASPLIAGQVLPIQFQTSGTLPPASVPITPNVTYFVNNTTTSTVEVYTNPIDAKARTPSQRILFSGAGTGTNTIQFFNVWTFATPLFKNLPFYDFNGPLIPYDAITFTPSAISGNAITITLSAAYAPLTAAYVGGAFFGNGGSGRITAVADTTHFTLSTQTAFANTNAIKGSFCLLAEPAWSDIRGWPQKCSSYQSRAIFANTVSLPNGFWASVINDYTDFGDLTTDDDDAISWFPSSADVNVIRFIVPFRSITVHTNTGIYSSPLSEVDAITPGTFSLQLQDSTPADVLQPQAIDNQIIVISGNDVHTMIWDGINNAYTANIISIPNEQLIRQPVDEETYADLKRAGSRYVFIINANGSMAIMQTLQSENILGFTPAIMEQSYGAASFLQASASKNGRCWFAAQRSIASSGSLISITDFSTHTLTATASNLSTTVPTPVTFITSGTLPASSPPINTTEYFWAIGVTADTFMVYQNQQDAAENVGSITFTSAGTISAVRQWPLQTIFTLEELTHDTYLDCAIFINTNGAPQSTFTTGILYNAQNVKMVGDGFGFAATGFGDQIVFQAHGQLVNVDQAYVGFPVNLIIEPMPLSLPQNANTSLSKPTHIRSIRWMFNNTIGGTINGVPIALKTFDQADIGFPPVPARGIFEMGMMTGWDDFNQPSFTIEHSDPFNIELLGIFYSCE